MVANCLILYSECLQFTNYIFKNQTKCGISLHIAFIRKDWPRYTNIMGMWCEKSYREAVVDIFSAGFCYTGICQIHLIKNDWLGGGREKKKKIEIKIDHVYKIWDQKYYFWWFMLTIRYEIDILHARVLANHNPQGHAYRDMNSFQSCKKGKIKSCTMYVLEVGWRKILMEIFWPFSHCCIMLCTTSDRKWGELQEFHGSWSMTSSPRTKVAEACDSWQDFCWDKY